jgi:hypothetical protein
MKVVPLIILANFFEAFIPTYLYGIKLIDKLYRCLYFYRRSSDYIGTKLLLIPSMSYTAQQLRHLHMEV